MGLSKIEPGGSVYTQKIHRDVRSFPGSTDLWINTLIMLDDSTSNNGATWIYKKSHKIANKPTDKNFGIMQFKLRESKETSSYFMAVYGTAQEKIPPKRPGILSLHFFLDHL